MTSRIRSTGLSVIAGLLATGAVAAGPEQREQFIVQLRPQQSIQAVSASHRAHVARSLPGHNMFLLELPSDAPAGAVENWLRRDRRVAWAEPNHPVKAPRAATQSFFLSASLGQFLEQYAADRIGADAAAPWSTGAGQIVAVLDTGLDAGHDMITGHIAPGGFNYVDNDSDFTDRACDDEAGAMVGHGTMVAGIILRVAPSAQILPMRVLNGDGIGTSFYVAQAIYDAIDAGATIINLSLGTTVPSQAIAEAVEAARAADVVIIATVGNSDQVSPALYPAALEDVIAVAGVDAADQKAGFSDYGSHIDVAAPAVSIVGLFPGNSFAASDGNSFATALVSGAAAVLRAHRPDYSSVDVRVQLHYSCDEIDSVNPEYAGLLGSGRINIVRAVADSAVVEEEAAQEP